MQYGFTVVTVLTLESTESNQRSKHVSTEFRLDCSKNLDKQQYVNNDIPTKNGVKAITKVLVQGLVANIHSAHQKGLKNDAEHLREVIADLEQGFIQIANVSDPT
jgi:hypothetical protein